MHYLFLFVLILDLKKTMSFLRVSNFHLNCLKPRRLMSSLTSPQYFNHTFKMPPRTDVFPLELLNSHPNDSRVSFEETKHKYSFDGNPVKLSVTGFIDQFFETFNPEEAVEKMMNGARWPRPEYTFKDGVVYSKSQVLKKWENTGLYARNRGTWMHYNIERYFNQLETANDIPEMKQFLAFYEDEINSKSIQPFRTEWRIAAPDLDLAGSVDFVGKMTDGSYCIMDWKRAKDLQGALVNGYNKKAKTPLEHMDSCDGVKYSLQLNLYKYILENYYDIPISEMTVATFHPLLETYYMLKVPNYQHEVNLMIEHLKNKE